MSILDDLHNGTLGFRIALPEHATVMQQWPSAAELQDEIRGVHWRVAVSPARFSARGFGDELQGDLDRDCRALFDAEFLTRYGRVPEGKRPLLRSEDVNFSVMAGIQPFELAGGDPAVAVTHHVAFEQGHEVTAARLLVPTREGTCEVSAWAGDAPDGWRASIASLSALRPGHSAPVRLSSQRAHPGRRYRQPASARCRAAMSYALNELAPLVMHDAPQVQSKGDRIVAPGVGGTFVLPPRYLTAPKLSGLDRTSDMVFGRVGLLEFPRWLSVRRELDARITSLFAGQKRKRLEKLADERLRMTADPRDRVLEVRIRDAASAPGTPGLDTYVRLHASVGLEHSVGRWWVTGSGEVVHIEVRAPIHVPTTELREHLSLCATSWEPMPGR